MIDVTVRLPRSAVGELLTTKRSPGSRLAIAQALLVGRRDRSTLLRGLRFAEPLWDMILEMYVAAAEGRQFKVLKLCAVSGGSVTTALRYLKQLEEEGYIVRQVDELDTRCFIVVVQPTLQTAVDEWLDRLAATMP